MSRLVPKMESMVSNEESATSSSSSRNARIANPTFMPFTGIMRVSLGKLASF